MCQVENVASIVGPPHIDANGGASLNKDLDQQMYLKGDSNLVDDPRYALMKRTLVPRFVI